MDAGPSAAVIADPSCYNEGLAKGLQEKLFFLDHLWKIPHEAATFVDFGCGDGLVLEAIHERYPEACLFGIERDAKQRELARERLRHKGQILSGLDRWEPTRNTPTVLILSSVLHEVVHYEQPLGRFWADIETFGFDVIAIRDMSLSLRSWTREPLEPLASAVHTVADRWSGSAYRDFTRRWGPIRTHAHLLHFLLKYRFRDSSNWGREVVENYIGVPVEMLMQETVRSGHYAPAFAMHYTPGHFRDFVWNEFERTLPHEHNTHVQMIVERTR